MESVALLSSKLPHILLARIAPPERQDTTQAKAKRHSCSNEKVDHHGCVIAGNGPVSSKTPRAGGCQGCDAITTGISWVGSCEIGGCCGIKGNIGLLCCTGGGTGCGVDAA